MIDSIIQEITGGQNRYCDNFKMLATDEQIKMVAFSLRTNDIEVSTVAAHSLFDQCLLADCLDVLAMSKTNEEVNACGTTFFAQFITNMMSKMQDCIDEYNEQVEANLNEPKRPNSDYQ